MPSIRRHFVTACSLLSMHIQFFTACSACVGHFLSHTQHAYNVFFIVFQSYICAGRACENTFSQCMLGMCRTFFCAHSAFITFFQSTLSMRKKYQISNISLSLQNKQKKFLSLDRLPRYDSLIVRGQNSHTRAPLSFPRLQLFVIDVQKLYLQYSTYV